MRDSSGKLLGINTVEVDSKFQEIPGTVKFWEADLILVSLKGESDGGELIAGSTAKAVLDGAHCSVVAVRPGFEKDFAFTWNKNKAYIC